MYSACLAQLVRLCVVLLIGNVWCDVQDIHNQEPDCLESNVAYLGHNTNNCEWMANSAEECQEACWKDSECIYFTYVSSTFTREPARIGQCCFKYSMGARNEDPAFATGLISGTAVCEQLVPKQVTGLSIHSEETPYDSRFPASNILHLVPEDNVNGGRRIYWLLPNGVTDEGFVIDMGSEYEVSSVKLWNTHNEANNDRGTQDFEVNLHGPSPDDAWIPAITGSLSDVRFQDPVVPEVFVVSGKGRYLQFIAKSYYGLGAGLQYIEINTGGCESLTHLADCTTKRARRHCKWFGPRSYGYDGCRSNMDDTKLRDHCFYKNVAEWKGCCGIDKKAPREYFVSADRGQGSCSCSGGGYACAWES